MAAKTSPASVAGQESNAQQTTMKASVHHRYGPPDVLALEEIDKPVLGDDDVLIRGHAAGLNLADDVVMKGVPYIARLFAGLRQPKHGVRGIDLAGTVTEVGWKVTDLRPGDEVFGSCANLYVAGAFAEYARAPRDKVVPKPATITFEQAAAIPTAACAALKALRDAAHVQPGQKVLINGASGGVGTFAVQIAKALGAQVTGVCSTRNTDLVRSIGADAVIDYTQEDFTRGTERFDVLLDNVANHPLSHCRRALTPKGTLIPNANTSGRWLGGLSQILRLGRENPRWGYLTPSRCSGSPRFPTQPSWWKEGTRPCTSWSTSLGPGSLTSCPDLRCATRSYAWCSPTPGASRRTGRTGFCLRHSLTPKDHPNSDRTFRPLHDPRCRRRYHHGVRGRLPDLPRQAIPRLGPARAGREDRGGDPADPRRDRPARAGTAGGAVLIGFGGTGIQRSEDNDEGDRPASVRPPRRPARRPVPVPAQ